MECFCCIRTSSGEYFYQHHLELWRSGDHFLLRFAAKKNLAARNGRGSFSFPCGHSLMVKFQPSKLAMRVRFPLPAISFSEGSSFKSLRGSRSTRSRDRWESPTEKRLASCLPERITRFWMTELAGNSKKDIAAVCAANYPPSRRGEAGPRLPDST
jgi:hypothetical protein